MNTPSAYDVIVAGAGPAGLAAACLLAQGRCRVALVSPGAGSPPETEDAIRRTVALMQPAIRLLDTVGVWTDELKSASAPLETLKLVDDTGSVFAAPTVNFSHRELGDEPFGWNIPLDRLTAALHAAAVKAGVTLIDAKAAGYRSHGGKAQVTLANGDTLEAPVADWDQMEAEIIRGAIA